MWSHYTKIDRLEYPKYTKDAIRCNMHLNYFLSISGAFSKTIISKRVWKMPLGFLFFFCKYIYRSANIWVVYINTHDKGGFIFLWINLDPPKIVPFAPFLGYSQPGAVHRFMWSSLRFVKEILVVMVRWWPVGERAYIRYC